ncbi:MAG: DEAD/DEAH box helicase [bacterium]|nr:DEAD/DEAH box helicase [bacterium]
MSFASLGLSRPLLRSIDDVGYKRPTRIQIETIPAILSGRDVMAAAETGTGKTASFTLPMLQRLSDSGSGVKSNHIRALVLTPTRELAVQVEGSVAAYGRRLSLKSGLAYGGVKINPQMMKLRGGLDLLVATPGRLLDLHRQNAVKFSQLEILVLDEADRMLDLGFSDEIGRILALLPEKRQNLLFSATFSSRIRKLTDDLLKNPVQIGIHPGNSAAKSVKQLVYEVDKGKKTALLSHMLRNKSRGQALVFTRTRKGADTLVKKLKSDGISAVAIHGDKSQAARSRALADFKADLVRVLVATDIASRGLDIKELPLVVNFDLPKVPEDYIHRIGRSGRAGMQGEGISLVSADEVKLLSAVETAIGRFLVREVAAGFIPSHAVPLTRQLELRPQKPKKPKKPKKSKLISGVNNPDGGEKKRRGKRVEAGAKAVSEKKPRGSKTGGGKERRPKDNGSARRGSSTKKRS